MSTLLGIPALLRIRAIIYLFEKYKREVSGSSIGGNAFSGQRNQTGTSQQEGYSNSNNHSFQLWSAEKYFRTHKTSNVDVDGLQLQMVKSGSSSFIHEQESETTLGTDSLKD